MGLSGVTKRRKIPAGFRWRKAEGSNYILGGGR
jgi:hypothetical protein